MVHDEELALRMKEIGTGSHVQFVGSSVRNRKPAPAQGGGSVYTRKQYAQWAQES